MAISVVMPALEMAQETGTVLSWRRKEGEQVAKGEPLLEVETDKAVVEVEAPGSGMLAGVRAQAGAVVAVGETIAWLLQPGEAVPAHTDNTPSARSSASAAPRAAVASTSPAEPPKGGDIRISPKARRLAQERGVDITRVQGTGAGGEILTEDILAAAADDTTR